jgi:hypothetical protein
MAREIDDEETADIAVRYAERHRERARILERKLDLLDQEQTLLARDIDEMEAALREVQAGAGRLEDLGPSSVGAGPDPDAADFHHLEQDRRERAAEERLEDLKRRMR